jgi:4-amino-4-deoxy-L-arabinose transferase-like glycosyltransferase
VLEDLNHTKVRFNPAVGTISSRAQQRKLQHDLALPLARHGVGEAGVATDEPPLYYALQTIPYYLGSGGTLLDQITLMRLLSTLMASLTALFTFLFLREALPGARWAWTVGALGVALFPLLGFISGGVNPDSMLFAVSAALFFCLARAFRRGLTPGAAIAIGAVTALGFMTKLNFIGLAPGVVIALIVLGHRTARAAGRSAYLSMAIAIGVAACPVCLYMLFNLIHHHPLLGGATAGIEDFGEHGSLGAEASYIWQSYMPWLPGMVRYFPGLATSRLWFDRSIGLYGWLDTYFPGWVYDVALIPAAAMAVLCIRTLILDRAVLRGRIGELLAYAAMAAGLLVLVGVNSYLKYPGLTMDYAEPRYLLPLAALFGALLALAARGAGRRWGPVAGTLIVLLVLGHDIFSQLLLVSRYYG